MVTVAHQQETSTRRRGRRTTVALDNHVSNADMVTQAVYSGPSSVHLDPKRPVDSVKTALPAMLDLMRANGLGLFIGLYEVKKGRGGTHRPRRVMATTATSRTGGFYLLRADEAKRFDREQMPRVTFTGRKSSKLYADFGLVEYAELAPVDANGNRLDAYGATDVIPLFPMTNWRVDG